LEVVMMAPATRTLNVTQTSNGLASGNTIAEAICHGLCEVIERDACKLAVFGLREAGLTPSALGLAHIQLADLDDANAALVDRISPHLDVALYSCASDVGVPTCWASLTGDSAAPFEPMDHPFEGRAVSFGWGTHPDPDVAISRALTEAVQLHTVAIQGVREDLDIAANSVSQGAAADREHDEWHFHWKALAKCYRPFADFMVSRDSPRVSPRAMGGQVNRDVRDDVEYLVQRLVARGMNQVLHVDLTLPTTGIPVSRVVVPGLEPYDWDRLGWRCKRLLLSPASLFRAARRQR
jgi:ribosomal protein S12 methylthiotransferase accessory factor